MSFFCTIHSEIIYIIKHRSVGYKRHLTGPIPYFLTICPGIIVILLNNTLVKYVYLSRHTHIIEANIPILLLLLIQYTICEIITVHILYSSRIKNSNTFLFIDQKCSKYSSKLPVHSKQRYKINIHYLSGTYS